MLWYLPRKRSLAILVPYDRRKVHMSWAIAYDSLIKPTDYTLQVGSGLPRVDFEREYLVEQALGMGENMKKYVAQYDEVFTDVHKAVDSALDSGVDEIVFLDSDIIPQQDAIMRFRFWHYPFVTGLYYERNANHYPSLRIFKDGQYYPVDISNINQPYIFVDACGLGFAYIEAEIFRRLSKPWFKWDSTSITSPSEDIYFSKKVWDELGIKPLVDLNNVAGHIGSANYGKEISYVED